MLVFEVLINCVFMESNYIDKIGKFVWVYYIIEIIL